MKYLEQNNKLSNRQHGFRSKHSCESQPIELTSQISHLLDSGKEVDPIILDFSKAFDKVNHAKLLMKLYSIGANKQVTNWVRSFLEGRTQEVVVDGCLSSTCDVSSGVPQGSVIGPTLFLIYINDLADCVNSGIRLFADDTVIYNITDNRNQLQDDLLSLELWESSNDMEFNPHKCEHIRFSRKRKKATTNDYSLHATSVPKANTIKYLGVKLEPNLKWNTNTDFITNKASTKLGFVRRTIPPSQQQLRDKAYKQIVRPVLEYSSTVWDSSLTCSQEQQLEAVQRRAARTVHNIKRTDRVTSTTALINSLEWDLLATRRERRRICMFRAMHYNEVATKISDFLSPFVPTAGYSRRHSHQYTIPHCKSKHHQNSYFVSTGKVWNNLDPGSPLLVGPPCGRLRF